MRLPCFFEESVYKVEPRKSLDRVDVSLLNLARFDSFVWSYDNQQHLTGGS